MPRGLDSAITAELDSTTFGLPFYAVRITRTGGAPVPVLRWSEGPIPLTVDGNAYDIRLMSISGLQFTPDNAGPITLMVANIDGVVTTLDRDTTFRGALVEVLAYLPNVGEYYKVWVGRSDEISQLTQEAATLIAYPSVTIPNVQVPRRNIGLACTNTFGNFVNWNNALDYEGSECPYQRVSTIGFTATLAGAMDASVTAITIAWISTQVTDGAKFQKGDRLRIDSELLVIQNAPLDPDITTFQQALTVSRGERDSIAAAHASGAAVLFNSCGFAVADCLRRGMYGNNPVDTYVV